jgi:hypothetical protein
MSVRPHAVFCTVDQPTFTCVPHVRVSLFYVSRAGSPPCFSGDEAVEPVIAGKVHSAFVRCAVAIAERYQVVVPDAADPSFRASAHKAHAYFDPCAKELN